MKMRFPMIAVIAGLAVPGTALAQQAEPEIDQALLAQLKCELYDDCAASEAGPVDVPVMTPVAETGQLVVAMRGKGSGKSSPFPTFAELQAAKRGVKAIPAAAPSAPTKPRPDRVALKAPVRTAGAPGLGVTKRGPVEATEAVAKRANLFVTFRLGSAELEPSAVKSIDTVAKVMKDAAVSGKSKRLRIAGHTDASGDDTLNTQLSADRAAAVRQALLDRGIPAEMLEAQGFGSTQPIDGYAPSHGINRRVEAVVIE